MRRAFMTALAAAALTLHAAAGAPPERMTGGNATLYMGGYGGKIYIIDEATEKLKGEIVLKTGMPTSLVLSHNKKHFYALTFYFEDIEVVDIASRKVTDTFRLTEGNRRVRIGGYQVNPTETQMVLTARATTRLTDRFEIGPAQLLLYDLKEHRVLKVIPWPEGEERDPTSMLYNAGLQFSPDGRFLYLFGEEVYIYDTTDYKVVDRWKMSKPPESGFGRLQFGSVDNQNDEPGFLTGLFTTEDPVQHRRVLGLARVNLLEKSVDFKAIAPAQERIGSFSVAPDRKMAYGLSDRIGHYEFWTFDLVEKRLLRRTEFAGRPRMSVKPSSNGKLLYIYEAGNTIDIYDAATYKYLRTITLDADLETNLFILPSSTP